MAVTRSAWPQCSPTWSLSPLSPCKRSSLRSSSPCVMCLIRSRQLVGYLCLDSEWSLAIRAVLVPSYQLRAHMKFNQIPSASLHNSDCWSCTAPAGPENNTNQPRSVPPSLPADDGGRQSCDIHPSLSSLNTLPSMWQRRITSHSHQLECYGQLHLSTSNMNTTLFKIKINQLQYSWLDLSQFWSSTKWPNQL